MIERDELSYRQLKSVVTVGIDVDFKTLDYESQSLASVAGSFIYELWASLLTPFGLSFHFKMGIKNTLLSL